MQPSMQEVSQTIFKSGEITKHLGISNQTIRRWVRRYSEFFSDQSKLEDRYKLGYTLGDIVILATIHHFSARGIGLDDIEKHLKDGVRFGEELAKEMQADLFLEKVSLENNIDPKLVQLELKQTRMERDQALNDLREVKTEVKSKDERIQNLLEQLATLQYRLGMAEGELNLLRRQTEQGR